MTERGFTGHKQNNLASNDLGLIYMNARYYVGSIGRFASADTLIPDQTDPQALNRYAYARNNPLLIVDPSGHCWGFAIGLRNTFYATTCNNLDMAVSIIQHPDASVAQKVAARAYVGGEVAAHTVAAAGSVVAGVGCLTGAGTAVCAGAGTAATASSADGDPTNEIKSIWELNPFARGTAIDRMFNNLGDNFPTLDRFDFSTGLATSIKSIDLGAKTYQSISRLTSTLTGYVNQLQNFTYANQSGIKITDGMITQRELLLAIPSNASAAQLSALDQITQWAWQEYQILVTTIVVH